MLEAKDLLCDSFDADKYRLIILSSFLSPSKEIRRAIDEKLRKKGRTLLWCQFTPDDLTGVKTNANAIDWILMTPDSISMTYHTYDDSIYDGDYPSDHYSYYAEFSVKGR